MKKYGYMLLNDCKTILRYRADLLLQLVASVISLLGILWLVDSSIYRSSVYSPTELKTYYILAHCLRIIIFSEIAFSVSEDIESGMLNSYLLMPANYFGIKYLQHIKNILLLLPLLLFLLVGCALLPESAQTFFLPYQDAGSLLMFVGIVALGSVMYAMTGFMIGLLSVRFLQIQGAFYCFDLIIQLLSGNIIPLDMFPEAVANVMRWNPFSLIIFYPISLYLGRVQNSAAVLLVVLLWTVVLGAVAALAWRQAKKSYQAYGGKMIKNIKVMLVFWRYSWAKMISYRFNFCMTLLEGVAMFFVNLVFFQAIYGGEGFSLMSSSEMQLLLACHQIFTGLFYALFMDNIPGLSYYINRGDLDGIIVRPVNTQFFVSFRYISFGHFLSILAALPLLVNAVHVLNPGLGALTILLYLISLVLAICLAYSMLTIFMSLSLLLIRMGGVYQVVSQVIDYGKYPSQIFRGGVAFTVILPIWMISNLSKDLLCGTKTALDLLLPLGYALVFLLLSSVAFRFSLKHYKSSGS